MYIRRNFKFEDEHELCAKSNGEYSADGGYSVLSNCQPNTINLRKSSMKAYAQKTYGKEIRKELTGEREGNNVQILYTDEEVHEPYTLFSMAGSGLQ